MHIPFAPKPRDSQRSFRAYRYRPRLCIARPWIGSSGKPLAHYPDSTAWNLAKSHGLIIDDLELQTHVCGERDPDEEPGDRQPQTFDPPVGLLLRSVRTRQIWGARPDAYGDRIPIELSEVTRPPLSIAQGTPEPPHDYDLSWMKDDGGIVLWDDGSCMGRQRSPHSAGWGKNPQLLEMTPAESEAIRAGAFQALDRATEVLNRNGLRSSVILRFDADYDLVRKHPELAPPGFDLAYLADRAKDGEGGVQDHFAWTARRWTPEVDREEARLECLYRIDDLRELITPTMENVVLWGQLQDHWETLQRDARRFGHNSSRFDPSEIDATDTVHLVRIGRDIEFWRTILEAPGPSPQTSLRRALAQVDAWSEAFTAALGGAIKDKVLEMIAVAILSLLTALGGWLLSQLF